METSHFIDRDFSARVNMADTAGWEEGIGSALYSVLASS